MVEEDGEAMMPKFKYDTAHRGNRCGHSGCSDCKTRRGRNRGNRRVRHAIKTLLRKKRS